MTKLLVLAIVVGLVACAVASCSQHDGPSYLSRDALLDPATCAQCHADHVRDWSGSMHAYASDDPVFRAMNKRGQRLTNNALGDFCVKCHAPMAVREGATHDGLNLDTVASKLKGVTCFFCHTTESVADTHDNPLKLAADVVMRGPFSDPVANTAHPAGYSALHDRDRIDSAALCGACHDITTGHGAAIERTFQEWKGTVFSQAPGGATCGQCHMAQSSTLQPIAQAPGVFARRAHAHTFPGVDTALTPLPESANQAKDVQSFLDTTLQSALCVATQGSQTSLRVILDNVAAGHSFPSGSAQDRRMWIEVIAYQGANVVYQSGSVADATPVTSSTDPDLWLLRDCIYDDAGKEVRDFFQAASYEGNALPGQITFNATDPAFYKTHVVQRYPRADGATFAGAPDKVTMRVRLSPIGLDVLDDLVATGDLDPQVRAAMPTRTVGAQVTWTAATATTSYVDLGTQLSCITSTNLNVVSDKVPAKANARCKP